MVARFLRIVLVLALGWLAAGCSALRIAYDNADTYVYYRATSYLDLDTQASQELDERIDEFFAWHRRNALPQYARIAEDAAKRVEKGLAPEDIAWGYDMLFAHARQSLRVAGKRIAPMLDRLTAQQLAHLEKRFSEENRRFAREFLRGSETERRKRRAKRIAQRLEDWVGNLSAAQVEKIRQFSERVPLYDELRDRERKRMQAELIRIIRAREAQERLPDWIANWERGRDPAHLAASDKFRREYAALLVELDKTLTPEQRANAVANFRRYAEDFRILARRPGAVPPVE